NVKNFGRCDGGDFDSGLGRECSIQKPLRHLRHVPATSLALRMPAPSSARSASTASRCPTAGELCTSSGCLVYSAEAGLRSAAASHLCAAATDRADAHEAATGR